MPAAEAVRGRWAEDGLVALLLFAAVAVYLSRLSPNLGLYDESYFLYEAKRIRDGEVYYRDIFQIATPLSSHVMAGLFWLFGTSMATARVSTAVLHAATGVVLYATARRLQVRRELAVAVVLAYPAICVAIWPYASWHWFSTLIFSILLLALLAGPWAARPGWAFVPGLITGVLIDTQHQKGVVLAAGVCVLFALDHLMGRRYPNPEPWSALVTRLGYFSTGVAIIVVSVMAGFVLVAGFEPIYAALVRFPLENYHAEQHHDWGEVGMMARANAAYTFPIVLKYSPVALVLPAVECVTKLLRVSDRRRVRELTTPYLTSGGRNPTPYQFLKARTSPERHIQQTLAILEERRVPYVIAPSLFVKSEDPVVQYIWQHYEPLDLSENSGGFPWYVLFARKDGARVGPPPAGS